MSKIGKPIKAWGGFCDGKLHVCRTVADAEPDWLSVAIFMKKSDAKKQYEDVRAIEIREVKP